MISLSYPILGSESKVSVKVKSHRCDEGLQWPNITDISIRNSGSLVRK